MNRVASSFVKLFAAVGVALTVLTPSVALRGMQALPRGNPVVSVTLTATGTLARIGDITVPAAIYNGNYAGPAIRVRPGDELKVHLINKMSGATNIHFHGIQSSPEGRGDNVQIEVPPQGSFDYDLVIPSSQPPGLYWYHSHLHGSYEAQVMKGLSGALLVDGFADQFPELRGVSEQLLELKDYSFDQDTGNPRIDGYYQGFIQSINGETSALFSMRPHETQLWHIGNQSANLYFHLAVPGLRFTVIGEDGAPRTSGLDVTTIDLKPASRMEILVTAGEPGSYPILSKNVLTGTGAGQVKDRPLGIVEVSGVAESTSREVTHFASSGDLRNASIDAKRTISFSQSKDAKKYYIDGRLYDHERIDLRVPLGNIEEWTIRNESDEFH